MKSLLIGGVLAFISIVVARAVDLGWPSWGIPVAWMLGSISNHIEKSLKTTT